MCVHLCIPHLYASVCETEIQSASWTPLPSSSCIIPPQAQDSTLSLRVTHGEAAPCLWRTEGITALSLSVTPALSPVMPPRWQVEGGGGGSHERRQTDRWQVTPARQQVPQTLKPSYISQCSSVYVCECVLAYKHIKLLCLTPLGWDYEVILGLKCLPLRPVV